MQFATLSIAAVTINASVSNVGGVAMGGDGSSYPTATSTPTASRYSTKIVPTLQNDTTMGYFGFRCVDEIP